MAIPNLYHRFRRVAAVGIAVFMAVYVLQLFVPWSVYGANPFVAWLMAMFAMLGFFGPAVLIVTAFNQWSWGKSPRVRWLAISLSFMLTILWFAISQVILFLVRGISVSVMWRNVGAALVFPLLGYGLVTVLVVFWLSRWLLTTTHRHIAGQH